MLKVVRQWLRFTTYRHKDRTSTSTSFTFSRVSFFFFLGLKPNWRESEFFHVSRFGICCWPGLALFGSLFLKTRSKSTFLVFLKLRSAASTIFDCYCYFGYTLNLWSDTFPNIVGVKDHAAPDPKRGFFLEAIKEKRVVGGFFSNNTTTALDS